MKTQVFSCPSCTAPIQYDGRSTMVTCRYCDANVIVPESLRPPRAPAQPEAVTRVHVHGSQTKPVRGIVAVIVTLFVVGVAITIIMGIVGSMSFWGFARTRTVFNSVDQVEIAVEEIAAPSFGTPAPHASPTPSFATRTLAFGSAGVGAGRFEDARGIALDQSGHVYVGEYSTGRMQVFDEEGKFIAQWTVPGSPYLDHFAVNRAGTLVIPLGRTLQQFDGMTGRDLGALALAGGGVVDDSVVALADGGWLLMMDDDIVRVNSEGGEVLRIANAFATASGEGEMLPVLAADGLGNVYALGRMQQVVYKFAPDGRYLTRFGGRARAGADTPGALQAASSIAVDGAGRVYVGDIFGIKVFDSEGRYLNSMDTDGFPFGMAFHDNGALYTVERDHVSVYAIAD